MIIGVLAVVLRIPMIIVTLGTLSVYQGLGKILCNNAAVSQFSKKNLLFSVVGDRIFGLPTSVIVMLLIAAIGWIVLTRTAYGRRVEAIGGNRSAAHLSGIPLARYRVP